MWPACGAFAAAAAASHVIEHSPPSMAGRGYPSDRYRPGRGPPSPTPPHAAHLLIPNRTFRSLTAGAAGSACHSARGCACRARVVYRVVVQTPHMRGLRAEMGRCRPTPRPFWAADREQPPLSISFPPPLPARPPLHSRILLGLPLLPPSTPLPPHLRGNRGRAGVGARRGTRHHINASNI